ncbi:hypothetical protein MES5069_680029 [Mesorhizobium escarrei]|uniref:Uncharacterized protein n=1 Tax=Mesorhizobium escarrei TaxID=666018 RepID=A0ABM9EG25_9HYPH|nr:hypothetical protein MES5069_680029 [Mesorhizobium escarrei]
MRWKPLGRMWSRKRRMNSLGSGVMDRYRSLPLILVAERHAGRNEINILVGPEDGAGALISLVFSRAEIGSFPSPFRTIPRA